jgi:hypothetical protein
MRRGKRADSLIVILASNRPCVTSGQTFVRKVQTKAHDENDKHLFEFASKLGFFATVAL